MCTNCILIWKLRLEEGIMFFEHTDCNCRQHKMRPVLNHLYRASFATYIRKLNASKIRKVRENREVGDITQRFEPVTNTSINLRIRIKGAARNAAWHYCEEQKT